MTVKAWTKDGKAVQQYLFDWLAKDDEEKALKPADAGKRVQNILKELQKERITLARSGVKK